MYVDISKELEKKCLHYLKFSMLNKIIFSITWKTIVFLMGCINVLPKEINKGGLWNDIFERISP